METKSFMKIFGLEIKSINNNVQPQYPQMLNNNLPIEQRKRTQSSYSQKMKNKYRNEANPLNISDNQYKSSSKR